MSIFSAKILISVGLSKFIDKKRAEPCGSAPYSFVSSFVRQARVWITFRGSRLKRSTSCDPWLYEMPIRDGHWQWPFSDGNRACLHDDGCGAEMFFSYLYLFFYCLSIPIRGAKLGFFF